MLLVSPLDSRKLATVGPSHVTHRLPGMRAEVLIAKHASVERSRFTVHASLHCLSQTPVFHSESLLFLSLLILDGFRGRGQGIRLQ